MPWDTMPESPLCMKGVINENWEDLLRLPGGAIFEPSPWGRNHREKASGRIGCTKSEEKQFGNRETAHWKKGWGQRDSSSW